MPASRAHIATNISRTTDSELLRLWKESATDGRSPGEAWTAFVSAADAIKRAHLIPGSTGKRFTKAYAAEASESGGTVLTENEPSTVSATESAPTGTSTPKRAATKRTTAKRTAAKVAK